MRKTDLIAVISDVHGNRWALEAVMKDIRERGAGRIVNLGDALYGPLDPAGTADLLLAHPMPTVRGNQDRVIFQVPAAADPPTLKFVRAVLKPEHTRWLEMLAARLAVAESIDLFHASPEDDSAYFFWNIPPAGAQRRTPEEIFEALGISQRTILCGHDHVPATLHLPDGRLIVNPGSVGLQAYTDDQPFAHAMRAGSPHARYALLAPADAGWRIEQIAVPYDWESAARTAEANGRPDWAGWLRTGWA